jgi:hypothetical protein
LYCLSGNGKSIFAFLCHKLQKFFICGIEMACLGPQNAVWLDLLPLIIMFFSRPFVVHSLLWQCQCWGAVFSSISLVMADKRKIYLQKVLNFMCKYKASLYFSDDQLGKNSHLTLGQCSSNGTVSASRHISK